MDGHMNVSEYRWKHGFEPRSMYQVTKLYLLAFNTLGGTDSRVASLAIQVSLCLLLLYGNNIYAM